MNGDMSQKVCPSSTLAMVATLQRRLTRGQLFADFGHRPQNRLGQFLEDVELADLVRDLGWGKKGSGLFSGLGRLASWWRRAFKAGTSILSFWTTRNVCGMGWASVSRQFSIPLRGTHF